jgi:hypothetical protein
MHMMKGGITEEWSKLSDGKFTGDLEKKKPCYISPHQQRSTTKHALSHQPPPAAITITGPNSEF